MDHWQERFKELMFGEQRTLSTMEEAAKMKYEHMPRFFYKYRSFCDNHIQALQNGVLYSAPPTELNDYVDTNLIISNKAQMLVTQKTYDSFRQHYGFPEARVTNSHEFLTVVENTLKARAGDNTDNTLPIERLITFMNERMGKVSSDYRDRIRNTYSVCCFSAANTISQMWAHYAAEHKGFCIGYDFKSFGILAEDVQLMFPVLYLPDSRIVIDDIDSADSNLYMYAATVKDKAWESEQEWRRLYLEGTGSCPHPMPKPSGIYLGARVNADNKRWMQNFCYEKQIPLFKMVYDSEMNKMVARKV